MKAPPRLPAARLFDRNCVLAATAAQVIAANALGIEIAEIVIGETAFKVGPVARDIRLATPKADRDSAVIASAGTLGLGLAAGLTERDVIEGLAGEPLDCAAEAAAIILPWIEDGRFARLVRALDPYRFTGNRRLA